MRGTRGIGAALLALASVVLVISFLPVLVPVGSLAAASRAGLRGTCHQRPERSFDVGGVPLGACARCTGLHLGGMLAGLLLVVRPRTRSSAALAAVATVALGADVTAGILFASWDHPWLRFASGVMLACSVLPWAVASGRDALAAPMLRAEPVA